MITFVIACYQSTAFIERVLSSVKAMRQFDFEYIFIDDGSTDDTLSIIQEFIWSHPQLDCKLISNKKNEMVSYCYALGINNSQKKWIGFLDHDDRLSGPKNFLKITEILSDADPEVGLYLFNCKDQHDSILGSEFPSEGNSNFLHLLLSGFLSGEKFFLIRRDLAIKSAHILQEYRYVPESYFLSIATEQKKTRCINLVARTYFFKESGKNGLSSGDLDLQYPKFFVRFWIYSIMAPVWCFHSLKVKTWMIFKLLSLPVRSRFVAKN